jgi:acetylornithine deacetylase
MAAARLADAELLARLVAFDTTSRYSNLPLADFLCDYLDRPGVRLARVPSADGAKVALLARLGPEPGPERRGLVLSGHMDVVPAEEDGWESDPFALAAPLALLFTYDEEVGTLGARRFVETWPEDDALPRSAVIGEPTSLAVARLHKGHLKLRVTLHGRAAHSGLPHLGENAIEPAGRVIVALAALRAELEREAVPHADAFPEVPYAPLNVGTVRGGAAINVVPDRCVVELGIRTLPGMDSAPLVERVRGAAAAAAAPLAPEVEVISDSPPLLVPADAPIVRHLFALAGGPAGSVPFATDAGWLQELALDCAIFGPGTIAAAHRPNEWLPKAELARARELLERTVHVFCRGEQPARPSS